MCCAHLGLKLNQVYRMHTMCSFLWYQGSIEFLLDSRKCWFSLSNTPFPKEAGLEARKQPVSNCQAQPWLRPVTMSLMPLPCHGGGVLNIRFSLIHKSVARNKQTNNINPYPRKPVLEISQILSERQEEVLSSNFHWKQPWTITLLNRENCQPWKFAH